jgi:hypothetical protein
LVEKVCHLAFLGGTIAFDPLAVALDVLNLDWSSLWGRRRGDNG